MDRTTPPLAVGSGNATPARLPARIRLGV